MNTLSEVIEDALKYKLFAWDLECKSLTDNSNDAKIPQYAQPTHVAIASVNYSGCWEATEDVMYELVALLKNEDLYALVFNAPYDHVVLHLRGFIDHKKIAAKVVDVLGMTWLLDEEDDHDLKYSVKKYLRIKMTTFSDVVNDSPAAMKLNAIRGDVKKHRDVLKNWTSGKIQKRPYPNWDSPVMSRTAVRKELRIQRPDLPASESARMTEELFGLDKAAYYEDWINALDNKHQAEIAKLEGKINEHMKKYATADAVNLLKLFKKLLPLIRDEKTDHVLKHEMAVRMETIDMFLTGMPIDPTVLQELSVELKETIEKFEATVYETAGKTFNINSTQELRTLLFDELDLCPPAAKIQKYPNGEERHIPAFTAVGDKLLTELIRDDPASVRHLDAREISSIPQALRDCLVCDAKVLERIDHPIGQAVLDYRTACKLLSTYVDNTLATIAESGINRLYSRFNCWATVTGRFASGGPNLQNIPSRSKGDGYHPDIRKKGPLIRKAFVGTDDCVLLVADHSQIELRIIAHLANEPNLIAVYHECVEVDNVKFYTGDVHSLTAKQVGCTRKEAKGVNFGFNYGMGANKYAQQNRIFKPNTKEYDLDKCQKFREGFFAAYGRIQELMDYLGGLYRDGQRRFPTIAGRYRHFFAADRGLEKPPTKGTILNSCVQGSAADILKYVIYIIRKYLYDRYPGLQLICQVHDELIFLVPKQFVKEVSLLIKYAMEYPWYPLKVPILSSAKIAPSWGAKDDDSIPEIGTYYARVDGKDMLFTENNWSTFLEADKKGLVESKAACAQLMPNQIAWCRTIIPDEMPQARKTEHKRIMTRQEMQKAGLL